MLTLSPTGNYRELLARVEAAGLLAPRPDYYAVRIALNLGLAGACWTAFALLGDSWWQLLVAVALGMSFVQSGFLGHDAGHRQVSRARRTTYVLGLLHMNLLIGAAFGWWVGHHNRHHSDPNNLDRDPDTVRRPVIFDVSELPAKAWSASRRFVIRFQSVMFFVLLGQEAWRVHAAGFTAARAGLLARPRLELSLVALHGVLVTAAAFLVLSPPLAVVFLLLGQTVFGFYLGAVFAPNHKGMPVYRGDVELDWLHRQVLTARNIRPGRVTDFVFGGLNYQVEHHLFPSMPRVNLRRARPLVRAYCAEHGIPYAEVSAWESYREVARFLGSVSKEARS
jgi:fatty acid desaturase